MVVVKDMSFKAGQELKISGKAKEATAFYIEIGHDDDAIALHFNPRFDSHGDCNTIVCNSKQGGAWMDEHRESCFPFQPDEAFKVIITFNNETFYINLPDGTMMHFPNRFGDDKFKYIHFGGDAKMHSIKIK
ncbi:lectin, galactoside-binding, soluble, 2b [Clupea harengus]|uniref:Galectin n=1 Tax=Clupea harengus TaxID=7950 RepID=A0A6P3W9K6_CLUHA|nr:lectin, galactoside-binding, soluble, 2b [Clupea harengus]